jgi:tetratricopeptide (TPR) repeat protein
MHVRGGRLADALADFEACIAADEKTARYRIHAGFALTELGRTEEALARFAEAAALDPSEPDAPGGAALVFYRTGNHQAATNALAKAADLAPGGSLLQNVVRAEIRAANEAAEEKAAAERRARGEDGANQAPR